MLSRDQQPSVIDGALYLRVSSGPQEDGYSLDAQLRDGLAKAAILGWRISPENIHRETYTGEDIFERPELTKLRQKVAHGIVQGVIYPEIDRFARDPAWLEMVVREHWHFGAQVAFSRGGEDLTQDTPEAYLMRQVHGYGAQKELQQLKQRIRRGKAARLEAGRLTPCSLGPLYGYRFADADRPDAGKRHAATKVRYVIYEPEAEIVRDIFGWSAEGKTIRWIAHELNRRCVPAARGTAWAHSTICKILQETAYYGEGYANRYKLAKVRVNGHMVRKHVPRPREEWVRYPERTPDGKYPVIPPIIDERTYRLAEEARKRNSASATRSARHAERFLLRGGFIQCGVCGGNMYGTARKGYQGRTTSDAYVCAPYRHGEHLPPEWNARSTKTSIRAHVMDGTVWSRIEDLLHNPRYLSDEAQRLESADTSEVELRAIDRAMNEVGRRESNLLQALEEEDDAEARAALRRRWKELREKRDQLTTERTAVIERRNASMVVAADLAQVQRWFGELRGALQGMPYEMKRKVLTALGVRATVYPADHQPRWEVTAQVPVSPAVRLESTPF